MNKEAKVEVLTAEVRALMVGSRQITLSVFRQLDFVPYNDCEPFGRVNDSNEKQYLDIGLVVGRNKDTGSLCRARLSKPCEWSKRDQKKWEEHLQHAWHFSDEQELKKRKERHDTWWQLNSEVVDHFNALPLIVLAGLK